MRSVSWWKLAATWIVALTLSLGYGLTLAPGLTWANNGSDSGDLLTAVATRGIPHPTGYPTYLLLARTYLLLPLGDAARQQTVFSAVCAIFAALIVALIVRMLGVGLGWRSAAAGAIAALWLGCSPLFWSQAVIVEIYSLHALCCAALWWFAARGTRHTLAGSGVWGWPDRSAGAVAGLALGNHLTAAATVLAMVATVVIQRPRAGRLRHMGATLLWIGIGLLVYLYLPLGANAITPASWGDPRTLAGLRWLVTGEVYHRLAFHVPADQIGALLQTWASLLIAQIGFLGVGLAIWGLVAGATRFGVILAAMLLTTLVISVFTLGYASNDAHVYLIAVYLIVSIWIGLGISDLLERVRSRRGWATMLAIMFVTALALRVPTTVAQVDASHDYRAIQFAAQVLGQAPPRALILTSDDRTTFTLWYDHIVRGVRADVAVVVVPMLRFDWYRANLRVAYPALKLSPELRSGWDAALVTGNSDRPICWTTPDALLLRCQGAN